MRTLAKDADSHTLSTNTPKAALERRIIHGL
jgi:hypothetical protein